jgi:PAT family beta-lactamase induction signal transducer AmpG
MAALMMVGMATTLIINEPAHDLDRQNVMFEKRVVAFMQRSAHLPERLRVAVAWFIGAVVCPFADFFSRNGLLAIVILVFIGIFRLSDITMGIMANPFYLDLGFSKPQIANVAKFFGFFMTIAGSIIGGLLVVRYGIMRPLLLGAVMVAATNLLFAFMATIGPDLTWLTIVISADNISGGLSSAVFIAYLSSLTNRAYTATQYALFSSFMTLPGKFISGFSGVIVDGFGYVTFFIYAAAIGIPAILLVLYLMRRVNIDNMKEAKAR